MDDYRKPIKANRYWNRPKPRVYDCNMRDAERMYKDNYKEYLAEKDFRLKRDWATDSLDRFAHLRAGPLHSRRREASAQPSFLSQHGDSLSLVESIRARAASVGKDAEPPSPPPLKVEAKPVPVYDPQKETQSLEERLARLKRLRDDLGLPADTEASKTTLRDSTPSKFTSDDTSSSYKSERSSRMSSRTGGAAAGAAASSQDDSSSSYSLRSERASKMNGIGGSSGDEYKFKSERKTERKMDDFKVPTPTFERKSLSSAAKASSDTKSDDYSFSSSTSSEKKTDRFSKLSATAASSSSPGRTRKAMTSSASASSAKESLEVLDDEDDSSVMKMMKKLPSSQEILEKISKMDLDD